MRKFRSFVSVFVLLISFTGFSFAEKMHVCVGSYKEKANAEELLKKVQDFDVSAFINEVQLKNGTHYRILLSPAFDSKEAANKYRLEVLTFPFVHHLKLKGIWVCGGENKASTPVAEAFEKPAEIPEPAEVKEEPVPEKTEPAISEEPVILQSNEEKTIPLSDEKPYSVLVRSYKEEQNAINDKNRLAENQIESYILKTYDDKTYFSFDLHSGAFETPEEAEPLQEKLSEIGIKNTQVSDYEDIKENIQKYEEVVKNEKVVYESGNTEIPDTLSPAVTEIVRQFPVNEQFQIEKIEIYDFDNMRAADKTLPRLDDFYDKIGSAEKVHAASVASYKDDLFGKSVKIFVSSGDDGAFNEFPAGDNKSIKFRVTGGTLNCVILEEEGNYFLYGVNENKNLAVVMLSEDFTEEQFVEFINNVRNDSGLLVYPQIRKTLFVLPKKNESIRRDFLRFELSKVGKSYAEERGNVDWAVAIVGHWSSTATFNQHDKEIEVEFFEMDYDYNAKRIHKMFMDSHLEDGRGHSSYVRNSDSWYLNNIFFNEVSLSTKSYIIAVASLVYEEDNLVKMADELQIWDK